MSHYTISSFEITDPELRKRHQELHHQTYVWMIYKDGIAHKFGYTYEQAERFVRKAKRSR